MAKRFAVAALTIASSTSPCCAICALRLGLTVRLVSLWWWLILARKIFPLEFFFAFPAFMQTILASWCLLCSGREVAGRKVSENYLTGVCGRRKKKVLHLWQDRRASEIYYRPSREIPALERKGLKVHEVYGLIEIDLFILSDEEGWVRARDKPAEMRSFFRRVWRLLTVFCVQTIEGPPRGSARFRFGG